MILNFFLKLLIIGRIFSSELLSETQTSKSRLLDFLAIEIEFKQFSRYLDLL